MEIRPEDFSPSANQSQPIPHKQQEPQLSVERSLLYNTSRNITHNITLSSLDLIQHEDLLCASLRKFLSFKNHTLHFPVIKASKNSQINAEILPHEHKILLPLTAPDKTLLGVFVAREADTAGAKKMLPYLQRIGELCLENISLYKQSLHDQSSGLFTREHLLNIFTGTLEQMREYLRPENPKRGPVRVSLLVLRLNGFTDVVHEHGYLRAERFLTCLALELELAKPQHIIAARSGDYEFALLLPAISAKECRELGKTLIGRLNGLRLENEVSGKFMRVSVSAGHITFPMDLNGIERHPPAEQTRRLLRRARLASVMAYENMLPADSAGPALPVLAYSNILAEAGRVMQVLPLSRVTLNLGKTVGARPGQRFTLWGYVMDKTKNNPESTPDIAPNITRRYKGELLIVEARSKDSTAELVYCDDPYFPPEVGDHLLINSASADLPEKTSFMLIKKEEKLDAATRFLSYPDFLTRWCIEREKHTDFALVLTRFGLANQSFSLDPDHEPDYAPDYGPGYEPGDAPDYAPNYGPDYAPGCAPHNRNDRNDKKNLFIPWEEQMAACAELFRSELGERCLYGRYGLNSFIIFVPGVDMAALPGLVKQAESLSAKSFEDKSIALQSALGIARHPFLDFHKGDLLENAHKALEYALLLPAPHVGVLDSLALNISADRRYSLGDQLGAISEYKRALLCDENNILAWNSLGVTLATLGQHNEARRHFEEALKRNDHNAATLYNLGQLSESNGEYAEALKFFLRCQELSPTNAYVIYRLGQLAEQRGDNAHAAACYKQVALLPGGEFITRRALAKLAIKENRLEDAHEELHEALLINPNDALALQLLAMLYLNEGENPLVAESLARQSAALRPDFKAAWLELARALEASGKEREAREAIMKAGEL